MTVAGREEKKGEWRFVEKYVLVSLDIITQENVPGDCPHVMRPRMK